MNTYIIKIDISSENYIEKTTEDGIISFIPIDPLNSDYQAYLASLKKPAQ